MSDALLILLYYGMRIVAKTDFQNLRTLAFKQHLCAKFLSIISYEY